MQFNMVQIIRFYFFESDRQQIINELVLIKVFSDF